jgi:hypothetical protein
MTSAAQNLHPIKKTSEIKRPIKCIFDLKHREPPKMTPGTTRKDIFVQKHFFHSKYQKTMTIETPNTY